MIEILRMTGLLAGVAGSTILAIRVTGILRALALVADVHEVNISQLMQPSRPLVVHFANATQHVERAQKRIMLFVGFFLVIVGGLLQMASFALAYYSNQP